MKENIGLMTKTGFLLMLFWLINFLEIYLEGSKSFSFDPSAVKACKQAYKDQERWYQYRNFEKVFLIMPLMLVEDTTST